MNHTMKLTKKQANPIVSQVFPDYTGRKFTIEFTNNVNFYNLNWDGGSKNEYAFLNYDGKIAQMPSMSPWNNPIEGKSIELPVNVLVIQHSYFCGQDCGITIYANPSHLPKWLKT